MALVYKLPSLSSSTSSAVFSYNKASSLITNNPICCLQLKNSPFTEKHSIERYQRDQWVYKSETNLDLSQYRSSSNSCCSLSADSESVRQNDIALQLPELKKLLQVLREKREACCGNGGDKRGPGNVFLVGTGPGDPELLTLKALKVIEKADLLLYDRLVSNDVLDLVGPDARLLYVGKTAGYHSRTQVHKVESSFLLSVQVFSKKRFSFLGLIEIRYLGFGCV